MALVEKVASGSSQITRGNQNSSLQLQEQAWTIEETVSTIEQMVVNIKANPDNSQKTDEIPQKAPEAIKRGEEIVQKIVDSIAEVIGSSRKIGDIINVVNEIAFQSKLIALNATVEAARAREQGCVGLPWWLGKYAIWRDTRLWGQERSSADQ